ncbi:MAG: acetate--CoA ligase family protein [Candidatus Paceibacterota bacterium]
MNLTNFFNPKTVAVIGASSDKNKVGYALLSNLVAGAKREIFPVSISEKKICGLKAYASIKDIDDKIDLAVIAVRSDIVPSIISECAEKKVGAIIVISAGFKEIGEKGKELEEKISALAKENNIPLLGPNCLGTIDSHSDLNSSFSAVKPQKGNIAFLSQSGALGTSILDLAIKEGVGFSKFISLGNEASLSEIEFLEYLAEDSDTKSILIYLEKLSDGRKFMELASEISKTKPIVVLKAGRSKRGLQAVMSHTGSLAPEDAIFSAACKQSGIIAVESIREFFNMAKLFQVGILKPLQNLVVLTNGGGPSVVTADLIDLSKSLSLAEFENSTKEELKKVLPPMAAFGNPVDIIGDALASRYADSLKILCNLKEVDGIILMLTPQMMTEVEETAKLIFEYQNQKPIIPVFIGGPTIQKGLELMKKHGLVNFNFPKDAVEALDNLATVFNSSFPLVPRSFSEVGKVGPPETTGFSRAGGHGPEDFKNPSLSEQVLPLKKGEAELKMLSFAEMSPILNEFEISLCGTLAREKSDLKAIFEKLSGTPAAMKAISGDLVHKTDSGVVKLNIKNEEEALSAWNEITVKGGAVKLEGMLVQPMVKGKEIIIGMKRDPVFGPTILFGLGGIFTEALKDTSLRIAPVIKEMAEQMISEIKGKNILFGLRGEKSVNISAIAELISKLSKLSLAHPKIKEIDLNPVMATENETIVVDSRIMV